METGVLRGEIYETDEKGNPVQRLPNPKECLVGLLYVLRENPLYYDPDKMEFWWEYSEADALSTLEQYDWLKVCIENKVPPPVPSSYSPFKYPCYFSSIHGTYRCPFWDRCWGGKTAVVVDEFTEVSRRLVIAKAQERAWGEIYNQLRRRWLLLADALGTDELTLPEGSVQRRIQTRTNTNWRAIVQQLAEENLVDSETLSRLIQQHTKVKDTSLLFVSPRDSHLNVAQTFLEELSERYRKGHLEGVLRLDAPLQEGEESYDEEGSL